MLKTIDIDQYNLIDVNAVDITTSGQCRVGMALGEKCGNMVRDKVDRLLVFPSASNLHKDPKNIEDRKKARQMLGTVPGLLDNPIDPSNKDEKSDVLGAFLQTKTGSIYVSNMTHQEAAEASDVYLSTDDLEYIDEIRNVFEADQISLINKK